MQSASSDRRCHRVRDGAGNAWKEDFHRRRMQRSTPISQRGDAQARRCRKRPPRSPSVHAGRHLCVATCCSSADLLGVPHIAFPLVVATCSSEGRRRTIGVRVSHPQSQLEAIPVPTSQPGPVRSLVRLMRATAHMSQCTEGCVWPDPRDMCMTHGGFVCV